MGHVFLPEADRTRDIYIVGAKQHGKSTFLLNCIIQDIVAGKGVGFLDPHGDASEQLLHLVPRHRVPDTIYFDPLLYTVPINLFGTRDQREINKITDDVLYLFRRFSRGEWGTRMDTVARYVLHTLLQLPDSTFLDINRILTDPAFRRSALGKLKGKLDRDLQHFWDTFNEKDVGVQPIVSRMSRFVRSHISATLDSPVSKFNFYELMNEKKVIICNLSEGRLGDQESSLLGSLIVSQIQIAAMRRQQIQPPSSRVPFYLYVDEFHNFISSPFPKILSEAGKYRLHLIFAHQYLSQLDSETRSAIFGNAPILISFTVGVDDAPYLTRYFASDSDRSFRPETLVNLPPRSIVVKKPGEHRQILRILPPPRSVASSAEEIIRRTKTLYAVPSDAPAPDAPPHRVNQPLPEPGVAPPVPPKRRS